MRPVTAALEVIANFLQNLLTPRHSMSLWSARKRTLARVSAALCCLLLCQLCFDGCGGSSRPQSIEFAANSSQLDMAPGVTFQLQVSAVYASEHTVNVTGLATYTTSSAAIATVSAGGTITAVAVGTTTVTAAYDSLTVAATITVAQATPTLVSIAVTPATISISSGATQQMKVTATFSDSTTQDVTASATYTTSSASVATVSPAGLVTAVAAGTATITSSYQGQSATATVTVTPAVVTLTGIAVTAAAASLPQGGSEPLLVTATFSDSTTRNVSATATYTSSESGVATVSAAGVVTAVSDGSAVITATYQGKTGTLNITITAATATSIALTTSATSLSAGSTAQLTATATYTNGTSGNVTASATYTTSNSSVATVSASGLITAVGVGTATITATYEGQSSSVTITVTAATATSIALTASGTSLPAGSTAQLTATATYTSGSTGNVTSSATYTTSNSAVATVSPSGLVTAVGVGTALITATYEGKSQTITITVTAAVATGVALTSSNNNPPAGTTAQLTATATYTDGSTGDVSSSATYSSSNPAVATVSASGEITAISIGTAVITATYEGHASTVTITVTAPAIVSITINPGLLQLADGTTAQLQALASFTDGTLSDVTSLVTWATSPSVATISASGLVTAIGTGTATATATLTSISGSINLTVSPASLQGILLLPQNPSLSAGGSLQLTAQGIFTDGTTQNITGELSFATSDPSIATVTGSGSITGVTPGSVTITAIAGPALGSLSSAISLTISSATLQSIAVTPSTLSVAEGLSQQIKASGSFSDGSTQDLTQSCAWASSNTSVAIIDAHGDLTALNPGTATITATVVGVPVASASVTVTSAAIASLTITPASISLAVGQLQALTVTATLSNGTTQDVTAQAALSISGGLGSILLEPVSNAETVLALAIGNGTLSATLGGQTAQATLSIGPSLITGISLPSSLDITVGEVSNLPVQALYTDGSSQLLLTNLSFTSSAPLKVAVDAVGNVTGLQVGTSNVTATYASPSGSSFGTTVAVTVTAATLQSISVVAGVSVAAVGIPIQLSVLGDYSDGSVSDLTSQVHILSSNPLVATVSNLGLVLPIGVGSTQISAGLNGITGTLNLNIGSAVIQSIAVSAPTALPINATSHLTAIGTFSDASQQDISSQVSWSTGNPSVGVVDSSGNATGVAVGTFNATASLNGISGQAAIQVTSAAPPTLTSVTVTPGNVNLLGSVVSLLGANTQFTATGNYSDGSTRDLTSSVQWSLLNSSGANITPQGKLQLTLSGLLGLVGLGPNTITVIATQGSVSGSTQLFLTVL